MTPEEFVEAIGTGNVVHNSGTYSMYYICRGIYAACVQAK